MKKIVVPVDYSDASDATIEFAKVLCKMCNTQLEVVSCWRPHLEIEMVSTGGLMIREKMHLEKLYGFLEKHGLKSSSGKLLTGLAGNVIIEISQKKETLMIVMGTVKKYGLLEKVIGSVASHVINNAHCPVLLIPPKVAFKRKFKNILVSGEIESTDEKSFRQIIEYTQQFGAKVQFTNVSSFEKQGTGLQISEELLEKIMRKEDIGFSFQVVDINNSNIQQGLNKHCKQNDIDLLILVTRKHRWWENLMSNKTLIDPEKIAIDMHRPILVFRIDE